MPGLSPQTSENEPVNLERAEHSGGVTRTQLRRRRDLIDIPEATLERIPASRGIAIQRHPAGYGPLNP